MKHRKAEFGRRTVGWVEKLEQRRLLTAVVVNTVLDQTDAAGSGTVSLRDVDFYLSTDSTVTDGTLLGTPALTVGLINGKSKGYKLKFAAPATLTAGTFNLLGVIDPNNSLGGDDASDVLVTATAPVVVN